MTLRQKLLTALAGSTSQNPISTEYLSLKLRGVKAELQAMLQTNEVCHCKITKPNQSPVDVWWLAGNANVSMVYRGTVKANKRAKARAEVEVEDLE